MDIISFNEAATANSRIEKFIENPDSSSGIVTIPKVIASGETITIPAGRVAILPNMQIDGVLNVEGEVFIPSGATLGDLDAQLALKAPLVNPAFTNPTATTQAAQDNSTKVATTAYVDGKMVLGTAVNATGTSIDFTGIPSWVKKFTVMFNGVSTNGATTIRIILGTSSGLVVSGYAGVYGYAGNADTYNLNHGNSFGIFYDTPNDVVHGSLNFSLVNNLTQAWVCNGIMSWSTRTYSLPTSGSVTLSGTLDRIRISTVKGTDTFDAGQINIMYEG